MDRLVVYREAIKQLLSSYHANDKRRGEDEWDSQLVFDEVRDRYLWLNVGWEGSKRIYFCVIHLEIRDGKVWLQQNSTDTDPAEALIALGVERQDIVLGLQPPFKRPYTNYGVA